MKRHTIRMRRAEDCYRRVSTFYVNARDRQHAEEITRRVWGPLVAILPPIKRRTA